MIITSHVFSVIIMIIAILQFYYKYYFLLPVRDVLFCRVLKKNLFTKSQGRLFLIYITNLRCMLQESGTFMVLWLGIYDGWS
jgi:hypothetical protein